jgi:hypothetical protein
MTRTIAMPKETQIRTAEEVHNGLRDALMYSGMRCGGAGRCGGVQVSLIRAIMRIR